MRVLAFLTFSVLALLPVSLWAVINVGLQPSDLFQRHETVLSGEIERVDRDAGKFFLRVTALHKGDSPKVGDVIEIAAVDAMAGVLTAGASAPTDIAVGQPVAAFVGKRQRRRENELLFYAGAFYLGLRESPTQWKWNAGDTQLIGTDGKPVPTMLGTWNGSTPQLVRMLADLARDRSYYPRRGYAAFKPDLLIEKLPGPVKGVALYDIDRNGLPDLYACSPAGDRVFLQMEKLEFVDATEWLGLKQASVSVAFADFDLDGIPDLLAGGTLLRGFVEGEQRGFKPTARLPLSAADLAMVHAAAFIEANGDGYPDILVSLNGGGLRLFLNPGKAGGAFTDITARAGLDRAETGAKGTGYFTLGDWNGDGLTDLYYAAGSGLLLIQDKAGRFTPQPGAPKLRFLSGEDEKPGFTGAGAFTPILGTGRTDLIVPVENGWHVIENRAGQPVDVTEHGNEISEGSFLHIATVAADLNLDGHVDFYTVSRAKNGHNRFIINRGYGSFMLGDVHRAYEHMFQGPAQELGGWGLAAGDANGDGQPDLLIGNEHGHLVLILNDTLAFRQPVENATDEIARMLKTGVLVVTVDGPLGVVGATVRLETTAGEVRDVRFIGGNNASGCRSPDEAIFAVREPGSYVVRVRHADGHERTWPVEIGAASSAIGRLKAVR
ncbi:MAG: VCBS repeat-containing protein [Opitutaceae bacterium]|nr:VCBS repeat-containing protein [Opitutaceae bacterium]